MIKAPWLAGCPRTDGCSCVQQVQIGSRRLALQCRGDPVAALPACDLSIGCDSADACGIGGTCPSAGRICVEVDTGTRMMKAPRHSISRAPIIDVC